MYIANTTASIDKGQLSIRMQLLLLTNNIIQSKLHIYGTAAVIRRQDNIIQSKLHKVQANEQLRTKPNLAMFIFQKVMDTN